MSYPVAFCHPWIHQIFKHYHSYFEYSCKMWNFCQVIDDSLFESPEEFELRLSDSSFNAKIGTLSSATVIIDGPNDGK